MRQISSSTQETIISSHIFTSCACGVARGAQNRCQVSRRTRHERCQLKLGERPGLSFMDENSAPHEGSNQPRFTHADFVQYLQNIDDMASPPVRRANAGAGQAHFSALGLRWIPAHSPPPALARCAQPRHSQISPSFAEGPRIASRRTAAPPPPRSRVPRAPRGRRGGLRAGHAEAVAGQGERRAAHSQGAGGGSRAAEQEAV